MKCNKITKKSCLGCRDDFYNGKNPYSVKECWCFKDAKLMKRKKVALSQKPPFTQKSDMYPSCYHQNGYVFLDCEKEDRQY